MYCTRRETQLEGSYTGSWSLLSQIVDLVGVLLLLAPEREVLLEELNDALGVTEVVFLELIDLVKSLLERVIGELASLGVILEDLVVEDREVKGESKFDGVAGGKINFVSLLVCSLGLLLDVFKLVILGVLGNIAVIITDHLDEEGFGLLSAFGAEDAAVDHLDDLLAVSHELFFDLTLVGE